MMLRLLSVLSLALMPALAWAHDPKRPELNNWFNELHSSMGPCCSNADGQVVMDADWESKDGHYRVRLDGNWIDVPDDAVVKEPNLYGRTLVWPNQSSYWGTGVKTSVRCFLPGVMM
jgi:hypothetical protein